MTKKNIITGVVAGIIAFAWGMASWMVLPFHASTMSKLNAEPIAIEAIKTAAPETGMYAYPAMDASKEEMSKTPHAIVTVNYAQKKLPICMTFGILIQILGALALTCLVSVAKLEKFGDRMKLIGIAVLFAAFVCHLPNWLWFGFTPAHTALATIDLLVAWGLAGIWISKRLDKTTAS